MAPTRCCMDSVLGKTWTTLALRLIFLFMRPARCWCVCGACPRLGRPGARRRQPRHLEHRVRGGRHGAHSVDGGVVRGPDGRGVGLAEDGLEGLGRHRPVAPRRQQGAHLALEVDDAALPAGARQARGDGAHEPDVGVADDEAHAGEPALAQRSGTRVSPRGSPCRRLRRRACGAPRRIRCQSWW